MVEHHVAKWVKRRPAPRSFRGSSQGAGGIPFFIGLRLSKMLIMCGGAVCFFLSRNCAHRELIPARAVCAFCFVGRRWRTASPESCICETGWPGQANRYMYFPQGRMDSNLCILSTEEF